MRVLSVHRDNIKIEKQSKNKIKISNMYIYFLFDFRRLSQIAMTEKDERRAIGFNVTDFNSTLVI